MNEKQVARSGVQTIVSSADEFFSKRELDDAIKNYEKALAIAEGLQDIGLQATITHKLGIAYATATQFDKSLAFYRLSLQKYVAVGKVSESAVVLIDMGVTLEETGRLDEAEETFLKAKEIAQKTQDKITLGRALHQLGTIYQSRDSLEKAEEFYRESIDLLRVHASGAALNSYATALSNLGRVEQALGKYDEALQNYEKALAISQKGADFRAVSSMLRQLADLERSRGRLEEAERLASNSLKIALELKDQIGIAYSLVGLGLIDQDMRKFEEAEKHLMESLKIVQDLGDRKMEANIHGQLGRIAEDRGDLRQARKCYERALEISRELNFEPFLTRLEDDLNHVQSKLQETVEKPAAPAERAGLMQRPTGGTKIASVLDMLADGDWHTFKEVCAKTGIAADQTQHLAEFLAEYEFVVIDKTGGRLKLTERVRTYLSKVMKIEDSRKRIGLSK